MSLPKTEAETNDAAIATMEQRLEKIDPKHAGWHMRVLLGFVVLMCRRFVTGLAEIEDLQERVRELEVAREVSAANRGQGKRKKTAARRE